MTDNTPVDVESLDDFAKELFGGKAVPPVETPQNEVEDEDDLGDDTPATDDHSNENPETPETPPKKKQTARERIEEVVAQRHEIERKAAAREAELLERLRQLETKAESKTEDTPPQGAAPVDAAPDPDGLDESGQPIYKLGQFDPQFNADWMRWNFKQELAARDAAEAEKTQQTAAEQAQAEEFNRLKTGWDQKVEKVVTTIPDFVEKGQALEATFQSLDPTYGTYLVQTLMEMDHGPEVLYYLANHVDEAQAIVASGARAATIALGRLEAQFVGKQTPAIKPSQAPEPPERLRGTGGRFTVPGDTPDLDSFEREFYNA